MRGIKAKAIRRQAGHTSQSIVSYQTPKTYNRAFDTNTLTLGGTPAKITGAVTMPIRLSPCSRLAVKNLKKSLRIGN